MDLLGGSAAQGTMNQTGITMPTASWHSTVILVASMIIIATTDLVPTTASHTAGARSMRSRERKHQSAGAQSAGHVVKTTAVAVHAGQSSTSIQTIAVPEEHSGSATTTTVHSFAR